MARRDGTPREGSTDTRNAQSRPATGLNWPVVIAVALAVAILISILSTFYQDERTVTNAPANTPPSTQQPDTTPPVNPEPAQ